MNKNKIDFKESVLSWVWIITALEKEEEKYNKCPIKPDMIPDHVTAQAWGYAVTGYSLLEQALKVLLNLNGEPTDKNHYLFPLFNSLSDDDKDILREYYRDFKLSSESGSSFTFSELDDFIANLDGNKKGKDRKGEDRYVGSFDWRYFLIEEIHGRRLPILGVQFLHEIIRGITNIIQYKYNNESDTHAPLDCTYSMRKHIERYAKYINWLTERMMSEEWVNLGDRLEIFWGPDRQGRYDYIVIREHEKTGLCFSVIPEGHGLPVVNKISEVAALL